MAIRIKESGLATSVQDLGRPGYYHLGIPISGAMDRFAMRAANLLIGNDESDAGLEAVFMGPVMEFTEDSFVAVTGAEMQPRVDGEPRETWTSFPIKAGQTLSFDFLKKGARIYIAIKGGIDVPVVLGSRATYALGALGGLDGRSLRPGDELQTWASVVKPVEGATVPADLRRLPGNPAQIRVMPGLYWHRLTEESGSLFFRDIWKVATEADRIGYRFRGGNALQFVERKQPFGAGSDPSNIVDSCYPYGSIQVPSGTEPIVLHRDAVSGGGYFMLGTVISSDMDLIGQLQPNMETRFVAVNMEEAISAREQRNANLNQVRKLLN
ncbi:MAG: biotin-dependent carboxyltransferase family protein [Gammaproteobacteria bacterium]|nr:biotin-dependent carboxyltransferase family protein [Gammaproteobacteria bacterium]MCY4226465.1 biotin-dependent carboxyltransferase family protein [Gammaproteobacteria bacterium]